MGDSTDNLHRTIGDHDARIDTVEDELRELRHDMREVLTMLHEARGGWKTLMLIAGAAGAGGALIGKLLPFWK